MRLPLPLAWTILLLGLFTSGLLRQFHQRTPTSPFVSPIVGSLLFAAVLILLLVAQREQARGAVPGRGIRLGSLTPLLLMLLIEKWVSITLYPLIFSAIAQPEANPDLLDAQYRTMAGVGVLGVSLVVGKLSVPTARRTWRRARPSRWPRAAVGTVAAVVATYSLMALYGAVTGHSYRLVLPRFGILALWIIVGQAILALGEEVFFRGLLLSETERIAPRLGVRGPVGRRWMALSLTATVFAMEHVDVSAAPDEMLRRSVFVLALGLLLGMIVSVSANLHFAAGIHAWINWLLLGTAPHWVDSRGAPAVPSGIYIGLTLIAGFSLALWGYRRRHLIRR